MTTAYIFDVDGTLTPSRKSIEEDFRRWLIEFNKTHSCYIVTGSNREKTIEQLGEELYNTFARVYNCSGNDVWEADKNVYRSDFDLPKDLHADLILILINSPFVHKTGVHIEKRPGMVNFSVVGRGSTDRTYREMYVEYDTKYNERINIASHLKRKYPHLEFDVGGETGIDIYEEGCNKAQCLKTITESHKIFFGDKTEPGGNDYPIFIKSDEGISVKDWTETYSYLKNCVH